MRAIHSSRFSLALLLAAACDSGAMGAVGHGSAADTSALDASGKGPGSEMPGPREDAAALDASGQGSDSQTPGPREDAAPDGSGDAERDASVDGGDAARGPRGHWLLQPGDGRNVVNNAAIQAALADPKISGLTIRERGYNLRPSEATWNPATIDACVAECRRLGKPYKLLIMSGNSTADWVGGTWLNGAPLPWSAENIEYNREIAAYLGVRYASDPLCVGAHVTGGTRGSTSEELHPDPAWNNDPGMVMSYSTFIDAYAQAFPSHALWLAGSVQGRAANYIDKIVDHGLVVAPGRFGVKNNALRGDKPGTETALHNIMVINAAKRGALMGFERVNPIGGVVEANDFAVKMADIAGYPASDLYIDWYEPDVKDLP